MTRGSNIVLITLGGLAASGWFLATTAATGLVPDALLVAAALAIGSVLVVPAVGLPSRETFARMGRSSVALAAGAGALAFAIAPIVTLLVRQTDAPSGSESLFFTTAAWGFLAVVVATCVRRKLALAQLAGALLALVGAAAVVANWERPSSFSPFAKFPAAEGVMLAAGLAFAIGSLLLGRLAREHGVRRTLAIAWPAALVVALLGTLVAAIATGDGVSALGSLRDELPSVAWAALSMAAFALAWVAALRSAGLARSASALFLPPVLLTAVAAITHAQRPLGPDPVQWIGVLGGAVLIVCGLTALNTLRPQGAGLDPHPSNRPATSLAAIAVVLGIGALAAPAFGARVMGSINDAAFSAAWNLSGFQAATGWLVAAISLLALAGAHDAASWGWRARPRVLLAACVALAAMTWPLLAQTPFATWNTWLPAEVLQDLGSEYARLDFTTLSQPFGWLGLLFALASVVTLVAVSVVWRVALAYRLEDRA